MRLHIRVVGAEQFFGAIDCSLLDNISPLTAAIVTFAGIAFGVFVGEDRAHGFKHGLADEIF